MLGKWTPLFWHYFVGTISTIATMTTITSTLSSALSRATSSALSTMLLVAAVSMQAAQADISVNKAIIEFMPDGEYFTDIKVSNDSRHNAYVAATVQEVIKPGQSAEHKVSASTPEQALLIATPQRLVIPGMETAAIRLLNLDESVKQERVYRVAISPAKGRDKGTNSGVRVIVAYDLLVMVRPKTIVTDIKAQRTNGFMILHNHGNASVILGGGQQCERSRENIKDKTGNDEPKSDKGNSHKKCEPVKGIRLYAGASVALPARKNTTMAFDVESAIETRHKVFEGNDTLTKAVIDEAMTLRKKENASKDKAQPRKNNKPSAQEIEKKKQPEKAKSAVN